MCLIINREKGQIVTDDFARDVAKRNSDGWGFMYNHPVNGRVITKKGLELDDFFANFHPIQEQDIPCIIHFRFRTHGLGIGLEPMSCVCHRGWNSLWKHDTLALTNPCRHWNVLLD